MIAHTAIHLALRNQALPALPAVRAWENIDFKPVARTPYCEESYVPATASRITVGATGVAELMGLYVIRWFGIADTGLNTMAAGVDALLARFPMSSAVPIAGNTTDTLRVRGDHGPYRGALMQGAPGFAVCVVTIPWRCRTTTP